MDVATFVLWADEISTLGGAAVRRNVLCKLLVINGDLNRSELGLVLCLHKVSVQGLELLKRDFRDASSFLQVFNDTCLGH